MPDSPTSLANVPAITTKSQIGLTWTAPTFVGGAPLLDYRIWSDQGTGTTYSVIALNVATTSYTVTGLTQGTSYKFKVDARNEKGYSASSAVVTILAAQIPDVPSAPTTSFNNANGQVTISWTAPDNGGSVITSYSITIAKFDNSSYIETASCDGTLSTVVSSLSCTLASNVINGSPYLVDWGSSVYAKVSARNLYGTSSYSVEGNGAVIITNPNPPTTLNAT